MKVGRDSVITGYRDHGHMLAYGIDPKVIMAELTGRAAGISKGKGGSMHMFSVEHGFYGGHGIVGAQVSLGTGLAFKHQYAGDGGTCLAYFGDGAANQGQVYESFNMAKLWDLPVIYAIENNQYAMGTSVERSASEPDFYKRGESFRIPGIQVDGMDVLAVRGAAEEAMAWTQAGKGPIILELKTYRYRGHSMSDPAKYRSREEVNSFREGKDPIDHAAAELAKLGVGEEELKAIDKQIKDIVVEAAKYAEEAPEPEAGELFTDVLVEKLLMATELKMPALSPTMEEGTLAKWLVKEGDVVKSGDLLAEIETDKATMEFEAVDEGTISKILVAEGSDGVKVGTVIALMGGEGEPRRLRQAGQCRRLPQRRRAVLRPAQDERKARVMRKPAAPTGTAQLAPKVEVAAEASGPTVSTTVREALRDAMAEEMRARRARVRDGRGSRAISGRVQGHAGAARRVRPQARDRHADHRIWLCRDRVGRGDGRVEAGHRVHDLQLRDAGDRPHHQFGGQDQLHVGRADALPDRVPRAQWRGEPGRRAAQPELRPVVRQRSRADRDRAL